MKKRNIAYKTEPADGSVIGPFSANEQDAGDVNVLIMHPSGNIGLTALGGLAVKLINKTNVASIQGMLVSPSTASSMGFQVPSDPSGSIGFVYEDAAAANSSCWVVVSGIAQVLLDGSANAGNWVRATTLGRVSASAVPSITADSDHWTEVGHCIETKASGSAQLVTCVVHFN